MRSLFIILSFLAVVVAVIMSILPFGSLVFAPALIGFVFGFLALKRSTTNKTFPKILIALSLLAGLAGAVKTYAFQNKVSEDAQFEQRELESQQEAIETLEELEELEEPTDSIP